jgi:G6PDH family F420-dependent oxidoreductase
MIRLGYKLSGEEFSANELVEQARLAEQAGFQFAAISDHYHPWTFAEGHSPFVWPVIGAVAATTSTNELMTAVTCPILRTHPAIIAQAAATAASMMPGRFALGVGTGEFLNEHILGDRWPPAAVRRAMLEEAIHVMRLLWEGKNLHHRGKHFTVDEAQLFSLPPSPPLVYVAANGRKSAALAGREGNALIVTAPNRHIVETFRENGGADKPIYGEVGACWAKTEAEAKEIVHRQWPLGGMGGRLATDLKAPKDYEAVAKSLTADQVTKDLALGPDPARHLDAIKQYLDIGVTRIFIHQIGPQQRQAIDFYQQQVMPRVAELVDRGTAEKPEAAIAR